MCTLLACVLVGGPFTAAGQGATPVRRIGRLEAFAPDTAAESERATRPLRELGWVEGVNLHVERRYANGRAEALQPLAEELVRAQLEVIVTGGTAATLAAKRATNTVPIVFRSAGDPVLLGLVASLARPGGNVTGYSLSAPEVSAKGLTVLAEIVPGIRRIGVLEVPSNPYYRASRGAFEQVCRSLGFEPLFAEVSSADEIQAAVARVVGQGGRSLYLRGDSFFHEHRARLAGAALKHGLPVMAELSAITRDGGALLSYTTTQEEEDRRAAHFVDRILRGAKPADLPVEQPTRFQLVINLQMARALGLSIPRTLLMRADTVIP